MGHKETSYEAEAVVQVEAEKNLNYEKLSGWRGANGF